MDPEDKLLKGDVNVSLENIQESEISTVDLGNKEVDFDELIIFTHTYLNYRKCECITKEVEHFSVLLTNNEFLMLSNTLIEENSLTNKEIVPIVKKKVSDYSGYEPAQKTNLLEAMPSYAKEIGFELTVDLFFPILLKIINEKDIIIEKFLNIFKKFIEFLSQHKEEGYKMIRDHMIPIINDIIQKKKNDEKMMKLCSDALLDVVKYIKDEDKGPSILTIIITLANSDDDKEKDKCKTIAAQLQNDLAPYIGKESCEMWIVPQINSFAEDHVGGVRKSVLKNFMKICETVSMECFKNRLLPIYEKLAKDSLWTVRKPAVEILPLLTKLCDSNTISKVLLPLYKAFESDSKNFVKHSAVEIFGQFITLLNPIDRTDDLLDYYISIVHDINSKDKDDINIACHCAYNFPAVLLAYGKEKWDKLKPSFDRFASENNEKVRGPIASALGEIAKIVGPEITEKDILLYVGKFYADNKLQSRILTVLPDIVRNISSSKKLQYLEYLKVMISPSEKWRKRMEYAGIIGKFNQVYSEDILYKRVFPIAVNFCFDDVAKVRFRSSKCISKMFLQLLSSETEYKKKAFGILVCFAQSINYHYRQLFIRMCQDLYSNETLIKEELIEYICDLAYDSVMNVRMTLAKSLGKALKDEKCAWIKDNEQMLQIINVLALDQSKIVSDFINLTDAKKVNLVPHPNPNEKFRNLMSLITKEFGITKNVPKESKPMTTSSSTPGNTSGKTTGSTPGNTPGSTPGNTSVSTSGNTSVSTPGNTSDNIPYPYNPNKTASFPSSSSSSSVPSEETPGKPKPKQPIAPSSNAESNKETSNTITFSNNNIEASEEDSLTKGEEGKDKDTNNDKGNENH